MVIWDIIFYKWKLLCVKEIKLCLKANYCFGQENFGGFWWVLEWECWWRGVYTWDSVNYFLFQWNLFLFNLWLLFPISKVFLTRYLEIQEASNTVSKPSWAPVIWTCKVSHFPNLGKKILEHFGNIWSPDMCIRNLTNKILSSNEDILSLVP